ncbi:60Kd inner membrane protein-domain-containing protein [Phlyctochytrium arcticum]|nr:60Kd inner membrane protein-domain-containing protein [Phlyctochytrium arcticum]
MGWLGSALPACSTSSRLSAFYTLSTSTIRSKSCLRQPSTTYIPPRSVLALASIPPALQESSLSFSPVAFTETALILAQSSTGLPWWLTIIGFTTALRLTITFPLAVQQRRRMARLASLAPVIKAWEATFRQMLKRRGGPEGVSVAEVKSLYRNKTRELFKTYNCHPIKTIILPLAQIPLWITTSLALRRMAAFPSPWLDTPSSPVDGFTTGGTSFFVDLSATDPTMIFPIAIGAMYLMNVEVGYVMAFNSTLIY